jgi:hypothetical protein
MEELPVEEALLRHNNSRIRVSLPQYALDIPSARPVNEARLIFAQLFHERAMVHLRLLSYVRSRILHNSRFVYQFLGPKGARDKCGEYPEDYECQQICL